MLVCSLVVGLKCLAMLGCVGLMGAVSEDFAGANDAEWIGIDELVELVRRSGVSEQDLEAVLEFLRKYFIEVDESGRRVRLKPWARDLFGVSLRDFLTGT